MPTRKEQQFSYQKFIDGFLFDKVRTVDCLHRGYA